MLKSGYKGKHHKWAWALAIIGALNWGLVGVGYFVGGNWNVLNLLLGNWMWAEALVYVLVGISGVTLLLGCRCMSCKADRA